MAYTNKIEELFETLPDDQIVDLLNTMLVGVEKRRENAQKLVKECDDQIKLIMSAIKEYS